MRDDARALALVLRYGRTSTAFQALGRGLSHWFDAADGADTGMVAFFDTGGAWVAAGEPVAPAEQAIAVAERFVDAARAAGRRASFFATEGILAASPRLARTLIGEQPVWDPRGWTKILAAHRSLREQLRRARAKKVTVRTVDESILSGEPLLRASMERIVARWLATRPMARMSFLVDVDPLGALAWRRLYVAERGGDAGGGPVALLSLAPVAERNGWLLEHLLRDPSAPNGTLELLVDAAMRDMAARGESWATLGLAPLSGPVSGPLRLARTLSRPLFNFRGLSAFKRKLRPDAWAPIYLAYPRGSWAAVAMLDGLRAFAGRSLLAFAAVTIARGPRPLLRALALLLVPWTIALALVPSSPWFPSPVVHGAWVVLDLGLLVALHRLHRTGSPPLARAIAMTVSADAALTVLQAVGWTIPALQRSGALSATTLLLVVIACAGPLLATPVLWGAARRLARIRQAEPHRTG
jgi:phosphatidylglycerol lysyltransferase